jgi:hypothetical protein
MPSAVQDGIVTVRHIEKSIAGECRIANCEFRISIISQFEIRNSHETLSYTATAMAESRVMIRECVSVEDFKQCIELEREV